MGGPIRDFRDLAAWQNAIELAVVCGEVADRLPDMKPRSPIRCGAQRTAFTEPFRKETDALP